MSSKRGAAAWGERRDLFSSVTLGAYLFRHKEAPLCLVNLLRLQLAACQRGHKGDRPNCRAAVHLDYSNFDTIVAAWHAFHSNGTPDSPAPGGSSN